VSDTTLHFAESPEQWAAARALVEEYAASLKIDLQFQNFEEEIESLPREYGPPDGCVILAARHGQFVACGGVRRFSDSACEMKRLYVVPAHRGAGIARLVVHALIEHAQQRCYRSMLLDTLPSMVGAQSLYATLGFKPTTAYRYNPVPGATFLKLDF
jgi:putative acetyltransferase